MKEHDLEPVPGLPEPLPPGEEMLWQGTPRWTSLARRAFHVWKVTLYFAVIIVWQGLAALAAGQTMAEAVVGALWILVLAFGAIGCLAGLAWVMARATIYTITSRRVVMRFGVALPMIVNFPFAQIRSAQMKRHLDGTGDIPLIMDDGARVSYLLMWPHVRPWRFSKPQPMLRTIPDVTAVADILSNALNAFLSQTESRTAVPTSAQQDSGQGGDEVSRSATLS